MVFISAVGKIKMIIFALVPLLGITKNANFLDGKRLLRAYAMGLMSWWNQIYANAIIRIGKTAIN